MQILQTVKIYKLITEVTGQNKQNPLQESTQDQQLAKDFAAFFFNKIQNIRKPFKSIPAYIPEPNDIPQMESFSTLTEQEIYQTIIGMPSESCGFNTIPKKGTQTLFVINSKIVNKR